VHPASGEATDQEDTMKSTKSSNKGKRSVKNLTPRKTDNVRGGRDLATGMASGKRQHAPVTITKEWGAASS
jgi:hypothetical protein